MRLGTDTGSMTNYLMSGTRGAPAPEIGMGATVLMWSDRYPVTIVEIERFKTGSRKGQISAVLVQEDDVLRIDKNGMSESQQYEFKPNVLNSIQRFKVNKVGAFVCEGRRLRTGERDKYHDYSF